MKTISTRTLLLSTAAAAISLALLGNSAAIAQPGHSNTQSQTENQDKQDKQDNKHRKPARNRDNNQVTPATPATPATVDNRATPATPASPADAKSRPFRDQVPEATHGVPLPYSSPTMANRPVRTDAPRWTKGDRLPDKYRRDQYVVHDWQQHGLRQPPHGYYWVRDDNNDFFLALIATGMISSIVMRDDRDQYWRRRYSRTYSYNDDYYYQQCRNSPDPAGVIVGGLIGGLIGNAAGRGDTGATIAGVIFGGAVGASLSRNLDCEDRSYAYRAYYDGFNYGRPRSYNWSNPHSGHRGVFRVRSYYNDPYGFRCARFTQVTYIHNNRYSASGIACRQPNGAWAVVN